MEVDEEPPAFRESFPHSQKHDRQPNACASSVLDPSRKQPQQRFTLTTPRFGRNNTGLQSGITFQFGPANNEVDNAANTSTTTRRLKSAQRSYSQVHGRNALTESDLSVASKGVLSDNRTKNKLRHDNDHGNIYNPTAGSLVANKSNSLRVQEHSDNDEDGEVIPPEPEPSSDTPMEHSNNYIALDRRQRCGEQRIAPFNWDQELIRAYNMSSHVRTSPVCATTSASPELLIAALNDRKAKLLHGMRPDQQIRHSNSANHFSSGPHQSVRIAHQPMQSGSGRLNVRSTGQNSVSDVPMDPAVTKDYIMCPELSTLHERFPTVSTTECAIRRHRKWAWNDIEDEARSKRRRVESEDCTGLEKEVLQWLGLT